MSFLQFLVLLIVAAVCGAIGQSLAGYSLGGCLVSIGVGFFGALIGVWLARGLGLPEWFILNIDGENFPVVWSIIGSTLLALLLGLISRRRGWSY